MQPIVIVSGSPGTGKSTLARRLAQGAARGLHLDSDLFYGFPTAPIDPALPAAHAQNIVVMRALARAARAFAEGGYDVYLDGVIGPWFLPVFQEELRGGLALSYIVLRATEADAVRRVRERDDGGPSARVRQVHAAFAELGDFAAHALETSQRSRRDVFLEACAGLRDGRFRLRVE